MQGVSAVRKEPGEPIDEPRCIVLEFQLHQTWCGGSQTTSNLRYQGLPCEGDCPILVHTDHAIAAYVGYIPGK